MSEGNPRLPILESSSRLRQLIQLDLTTLKCYGIPASHCARSLWTAVATWSAFQPGHMEVCRHAVDPFDTQNALEPTYLLRNLSALFQASSDTLRSLLHFIRPTACSTYHARQDSHCYPHR